VRGVEIILALVVLATAVAASARRLRVPAPSLLVVAGILVALLPGVPAVTVPPDAVSLVVLPPLLFAAGQDLSWRELRPVWRPVFVLAIGLVAASAAAVGAVSTLVAGLPATMAFVLGAVLASTDPVAVTALGRRLALPSRLHALIQAESLFNDASSLVLVRVAVIAAAGGSGMSWPHGLAQFGWLAGGGVLVGAVVAASVTLLRRRSEDPVLETVIALLTPYGAYLAAETLRVSGVTAVVVTSVILAGRAARLTSAQIRLQLHAVSDTVVFLLESVVFALIGLQLPSLVRMVHLPVWLWIWQTAAIMATLLVVRALWVFPLSLVMQARDRVHRSWWVPAVVSWAGARGVLPLTAALSIPLTTSAGAPLVGRDHVLLLTSAVIATTLIVQGFTLGPLVNRSGVTLPPGHGAAEHALASTAMARAALARLDELENLEAAPLAALEQARHLLCARVADPDGPNQDPLDDPLRALRRDLLSVEAAELARLYHDGTIGRVTRQQLQRRLDLERASLDG
jgi:CPA1 family monovalent cation:H+ antiporter